MNESWYVSHGEIRRNIQERSEADRSKKRILRRGLSNRIHAATDTSLPDIKAPRICWKAGPGTNKCQSELRAKLSRRCSRGGGGCRSGALIANSKTSYILIPIKHPGHAPVPLCTQQRNRKHTNETDINKHLHTIKNLPADMNESPGQQ